MSIVVTPGVWLDQDGTGAGVVSTGVAGTGKITILSGDGNVGIEGLDLTGTGVLNDSANIARVIKPILEHMFQHQEGLATEDKPTKMTIHRSTFSSGTTMYMTYTLRFEVDPVSAEVSAE